MKGYRTRFLLMALVCLLLVCAIPVRGFAEENQGTDQLSDSKSRQINPEEEDRNAEETDTSAEEDRFLPDGQVKTESTESKEPDTSVEENQKKREIVEKDKEIPSKESFSYEQEFPEEGMKVTITAEEVVIPENAAITVEPVGLSVEAAEQMQREMEAETEKRAVRSEEERSIFDMYRDLQISAGQPALFDIEIFYTDASGNRCVFEPEEGQSVWISMELEGLEGINADEMQEAGLFYVPDAYVRKGRSAGANEEGLAILTEQAAISGNTITFEAKHLSIYAVVLFHYRAFADVNLLKAEETAWNMICNYADPDYFLQDPYRKKLTDGQLEELRKAALSAAAGCNTPYEKIKAIAGFVAERTYYDYKYLADKKKNPTYIHPYEVYTQKRTVCAGYAALARTLLISIGIPCMDLNGENHEYNCAYDASGKRWVVFDATWCSQNKYTEEGEWIYQGCSYQRFDLTPQQLAELSSHEIYRVDGLLDGRDNTIYYMLDTKEISAADYKNWSSGNWHLAISDAKNVKKIKAVTGFAGFEVRELKKAAFSFCNSFQEADLSSARISNLYRSSFSGCNALERIQFPAELTELEEYAFYHCENLKKADLSRTKLTSLNQSVFSGCIRLADVKFPSSLKELGGWAFYECRNLKKADLSSTKITKIGRSAFSGCSSMAGVKFPSSLKEIDRYGFYNCSKLKEINLYETRTERIGYASFYNCKAAKTVKLPSGFKTAEKFAFACKGTKRVKTIVLTSLSAKKIGYTNSKKYIWNGRTVTIRPYTYQVTFHANHKSAKGSMKKITCTYGKKKKLPANQFKRSGYVFAGWNTKKNGKGTQYKNKASVKNLTAKQGKSVKLYAQWKKR